MVEMKMAEDDVGYPRWSIVDLLKAFETLSSGVKEIMNWRAISGYRAATPSTAQVIKNCIEHYGLATGVND